MGSVLIGAGKGTVAGSKVMAPSLRLPGTVITAWGKTHTKALNSF